MEITAMFIGKKWQPYQKTGLECSFTVHSVFNRIINISTGKELLSIAADDTGGSSAFLTLAARELNLGLKAGEKGVLRAGLLILAGLTINFVNAPVWKGPITGEYRHSVKKENIAVFKSMLDRKAAPQSAYRCIIGESDSPAAIGLNAIRKLRENPSQALNLIGLGPGLTPSGDDMLIGFLAIANHTYENREFISILHGIVSNSLNKTPEISAQALENALSCDYIGYIQKCIRDLCEGTKEELCISTASLLKMGATSGSDIACGMYFGMIDEKGVMPNDNKNITEK